MAALVILNSLYSKTTLIISEIWCSLSLQISASYQNPGIFTCWCSFITTLLRQKLELHTALNAITSGILLNMVIPGIPVVTPIHLLFKSGEPIGSKEEELKWLVSDRMSWVTTQRLCIRLKNINKCESYKAVLLEPKISIIGPFKITV